MVVLRVIYRQNTFDCTEFVQSAVTCLCQEDVISCLNVMEPMTATVSFVQKLSNFMYVQDSLYYLHGIHGTLLRNFAL